MRYKVTFFPRDTGKYRVYVYFNGADVRGSPFSIRVGTQGSRSKSRNSSTSTYDKSHLSSLERKMNGLNTQRTSPSPNYCTSQTIYKSPSPTYHSNSYKTTTNNYSSENSRYTSSPLARATSPEVSKYQSTLTRQRSPESSKFVTSSPLGRRPRSPETSPSIIKETKEIYSSSYYNRSRY